MSTPKKIDVAIIGGGLGGCALALGLAKHPHINFTIYEGRDSFAEVGAGIGMWTNGHKALSLISPTLWERYQKVASFSDDQFDYYFAEKGDLEGRAIERVPPPEDWSQSTVHRGHVLNVLVELLPEDCTRFNKRLIGVDETQNKIICNFADGTQAEADLVVGCDGIKSACRKFVFGVDSPLSKASFTGFAAYRGVIPMQEAIGAIGVDKAMAKNFFLGHNRHVITYEIAKKTLVNIVAFQHHNEEAWDGALIQPRTTEEVQRDSATYGHDASSIMKLLTDTKMWAIFYHPAVDTFHKSRLCLLGDAAHSMPPYLGMGGGMTMEDAYVLSGLLGQCTKVAELPAVLTAYDAARVERTCNVITASQRRGKARNLESKDVDLEGLARELDDEGIRWIWDLDVEKHFAEAVEVFDKARTQL